MDTKYLRQILFYTLTTVLSVGVVAYVAYHLFYGLTQRVETTPALYSTVAEVVDAQLYIFRDETPVPVGSGGGSLIPAVEDGARVGVGDVISRRYDVSAPDTVARIEETDLLLGVIREVEEQKLFARDTAVVEGEIYSLLLALNRDTARGQCDGVLSLRASLSAALNRRGMLIGQLSDTEGAIKQLQAERAALTARLGVCRQEIKSTLSGYYYAYCDGYESLFDAETALSMTPAQFSAMRYSEADAATPTAGKIAQSYRWYAACLTEAEAAKALQVGETCRVVFPYSGGKILSMRLERAEESEEGTMLVLSSGNLPSGFVFTRSQPATLHCREYSGIRLPLSALRVTDGVPGVFVLEGGIVRYRAVSVMLEGEDWFIADPAPEEDPPENTRWLARNDIVITSGRGLYEGRVLG